MKNALLLKISAALLVLCVLAGVAWSVTHSRVHASARAAAAATPEQVFAAIPPPGSAATAADKEIARWMDKARANTSDDKMWVNLGDALMQKPRENADFRYYGYAQQAYGQALAHNPHNADALDGMAWVTSDRHQFDQSVAYAKQSIAINPRNNTAYGLWGDADVELGHYDDAFAHYQSMLDIRPDLSSYSRGAHLLFLTGDSRKAMWLMVKAIKAGGPYAENTAWCRAQLGLMLFNEGALMPADGVLQDALKATPNNFQVLAAMGRIKAAERDYPAAIADYQKALAIQPNLDVLVALGDVYQATGRTADAEKEYAAVEEMHRKNTDVAVHDHMQMALFYADHDRNLVQAMQFAEEHKLSPNVNDADTLAWCYYKNGLLPQAKAASDRALSRHTPDARYLFHAGMIAAKMGDRVGAQKDLYQALSMNPGFSPLSSLVATSTLKQLGSAAPNAKVAAAR